MPDLKDFKKLKEIDDIKKFYIISAKNKLGEGSFGKVYKAERVGLKVDYALKVIKKSTVANQG